MGGLSYFLMLAYWLLAARLGIQNARERVTFAFLEGARLGEKLAYGKGKRGWNSQGKHENFSLGYVL